VKAIEEAAHTGLRGDGLIYVTTIETVVRIRTGERGEEALSRGGESEGTGE
jgi:nitrogen regulatory protein P-II 1